MSMDFPLDSPLLQRALEHCRQAPELATCLPPACYTDAEVHDWETNRLLRETWIGIGRADRVVNSGDFTTCEILGIPLIIIRDAQGRLRVFNNSCRHRGARLLDGSGNCRLIRCPFHSWSYAPDGQLVSAPDMELAKNFSTEDNGLVEFHVQVHAGFLFVCFSDEPPLFEGYLGNFDSLHEPWSLDLLVTTRRKRFFFNCNWKAFLEVFNEYYHLRFVHPDSINSLYRKPDAADKSTGEFVSQFGVTDGTGALLENQQEYALPGMPELTGRAGQGARYTWLFPNMTFAAGNDALWVYEAYPASANQCVVFQSICFPEATLQLTDFEQRVQFYYDRLDAALEEDRVALENQHLGLGSPYARAGRFSPLLEANVAGFAKWYASRIVR